MLVAQQTGQSSRNAAWTDDASERSTPSVPIMMRVADVVPLNLSDAAALLSRQQAESVPASASKAAIPDFRGDLVTATVVNERVREARKALDSYRSFGSSAALPSASFARSKAAGAELPPLTLSTSGSKAFAKWEEAAEAWMEDDRAPPPFTPSPSLCTATEEDLREHKHKIQEIARRFARRAVRGVSLRCFSQSSRVLVRAIFMTDESIRSFQLFTPTGVPPAAADAIPVRQAMWKDISRILRNDEIANAMPELLLPKAYRSRSLVIVAKGLPIIAVWDLPEERNDFYAGLNVIKAVQPYLALIKVQANIRMRLKTSPRAPSKAGATAAAISEPPQPSVGYRAHVIRVKTGDAYADSTSGSDGGPEFARAESDPPVAQPPDELSPALMSPPVSTCGSRMESVASVADEAGPPHVGHGSGRGSTGQGSFTSYFNRSLGEPSIASSDLSFGADTETGSALRAWSSLKQHQVEARSTGHHSAAKKLAKSQTASYSTVAVPTPILAALGGSREIPMKLRTFSSATPVGTMGTECDSVPWEGDETDESEEEEERCLPTPFAQAQGVGKPRFGPHQL